MRCVFDTNVFVSALLSPESKPRLAVDMAHVQGEILLSSETLRELYDVLSRQRFRRYIDAQDIPRLLAALTHEAQWIDNLSPISVCRDPKDNKFLSLAVTGRATHIITGDADLLVLHPFRGIPILTPSQFLEKC
ncbi:putative toxin-antitoxin system toxin component, PIN family [Alloacidobacterium dinghuense]|uniref:Putative toxin-antitoxin system toxin component, PIN family n=1 Tax=Alloacidobacterium dinghuense TaxID=2763107 RepID=A0A7G8BIZ0_9BACT|nr:putative toxin-antitoxin system toxin component, PIN family [Alloacidobacterium dinghuense]QNI32510.1 putative toxin-antitoxin system toxin component, PIN family [Alloacidobacterium dinghuense]